MQTATKNPAIPRTPRCSAKNAVSCLHISATKATAGRTCSETRTATVAQAHATGDPLSQKRIAVWSPLLHHELLRKSSAPALKTPARLVSAKAATMVGIPVNFELVMAVAVGSFFVHHFYMGFAVGAARKKYGVKYPDLYATKDNCPKEEEAKAFNCIQRGHQNSLELQPIFLTLLLCAGLKHPITAGVIGSAFLVARVLYFTGYSTGVPANRGTGGIGAYLCIFTLTAVILKSVAVWGISLMA